MGNENRIEWLDSAKGLGMLIVVFSHVLLWSQRIRIFIFAFHMPIFFFWSGVVFSGKKEFGTFFRKKVKTLYVPYVVFLTADYLLYAFLQYRQNTLVISETVKLYAKGLFGMSIDKIINQPLWFLSTLLVMELLMYVVVKLPKWAQLLFCALCILGAKFLNTDLPFSLSYVFHAVPYFMMGMFWKELSRIGKIFSSAWMDFVLIVAGLILLFELAQMNGAVDIQCFQHGKLLALYYICGFLGCAVFSSIAWFLRKDVVLHKISRNTTIILCCHYPFARIITPILVEKIGMSAYLYTIPMELALATLTMILMCAVVWICNRYFWFVFGKKRKTRDA